MKYKAMGHTPDILLQRDVANMVGLSKYRAHDRFKVTYGMQTTLVQSVGGPPSKDCDVVETAAVSVRTTNAIRTSFFIGTISFFALLAL